MEQYYISIAWKYAEALEKMIKEKENTLKTLGLKSAERVLFDATLKDINNKCRTKVFRTSWKTNKGFIFEITNGCNIKIDENVVEVCIA